MKKLILIFIFFSINLFSMENYNIENLDIKIDIKNDGSINIEKKILYNIKDINGIFYKIDTVGFGKLKNLEIYYEDNDRNMLKKAREGSYLDNGTYNIGQNNGIYKIILNTPAKNIKKEFIFRYTLTKGVNVYQDIAQFNRKIVSDDWDKKIHHITAKIIFPTEIKRNRIKAFGHGSLEEKIDFINNNEILYTLQNYSPGDFLEANIIFPKEVIENIKPEDIKPENMYQRVIMFEKKKEIANVKRRDLAIHKEYLMQTFLIFGIIFWIALMLMIYLKNNKRHKKKINQDLTITDLNFDINPAIAGTIISRKPYPERGEIIATFLDLIRRNYISVDSRDGKTILSLSDKSRSNLKDYEKFLLKIIINKVGDGKEIILENVNMKDQFLHNNHFYNDYKRWQIMVHTDMLAMNLKNEKKDNVSICVGLIFGFIYLGAGIKLSVYFNMASFIILSILGVILIPYALTRNKFGQEKEKFYFRCKNYYKILESCNFQDKFLIKKEWEKYFVYAVSLGIANKFLRNNKKISKLIYIYFRILNKRNKREN